MEEHAINTFEITEYWSDIGTLDQYKQTTQDLFEGKCSFSYTPIVQTDCGQYISASDKIDKTVKFVGCSTIGQNTVIGKNSTIENSIIWDNVHIGENISVKNCIISSNSQIYTDINSQIIGANQIIKNEVIKSST